MYGPRDIEQNMFWEYILNTLFILMMQMQKLKEQLSQAEKENQRLSERAEGGGSSNSPSPSLSMEANIDPPFFGEFGVEYDGVFYMPQNNSINGMEWMNLYMWT